MPSIDGKDIKKLVVACDAGMGSSVLLASTLKKQLKKFGVEVTHTPVAKIPDDADVVLTQEGLAARARATQPEKVIVPFKVFMGDPAFTKVINAVKDGGTVEG